ncbi:MAG: N-terminal double-transmembrane domain [Rhodobacteraceae bacterium HLUCCA09]|nr:MAG: N-terminal double-transmembrane domain [Rhodobacteraceae bacterium HLUCCA09]
MWTIGALGFTAPLLLLGLIALPVLWILLRAVPPAPIRRRFPGVALLLGLSDDETQTDRTPWWLLLLRMLAAAAVIFAFAGPVLNPQTDRAGSGPVLILVDATWADARDWPNRLDRIEGLLADAARTDRPVALVATTDLPPGDVPFQAPGAWESRLPGFAPEPWAPEADALTEWAEALDGGFETWWLSDGLAREAREPVLAALEDRGAVTVFESPRPLYGLRPATFEDGLVQVTALRARAEGASEVTISAMGLDPTGTERRLAQADAAFPNGEREAAAELSLPPELRNRITRFEVDGGRSAGAITLTDDSLRRREVALIAGRDNREGLELLSSLHYLEQALEPTADLIDGALDDILLANPDAIILADVAAVSAAEQEGLLDWVETGGLLVRFAGPRVASSDVSRGELDPLMPVRLRQGGRSVGGAMSWGEPKTLASFEDGSPFHGLDVPEDVTVQSQVMAQPDPELAERSIAKLTDGTPLVTRRGIGEGEVILFHVTANAEWSSLPLSGLFVQMLERLAISTRPAQPSADDLEGTVWEASAVLDAFGRVQDAGTLPGVEGTRLAEGRLGPDMPPGLYEGEDRSVAVNVLGPDATLAPAAWPARIPVEGLDVARETVLKGYVLALALALLAADIVASLFLSGRLRGMRAGGTAAVLAAALILPGVPADAQDAQSEEERFALQVTNEVVLAHVITGDAQIDRVALAGLHGLSETLFRRTSIEPADPIGVNLETDELAFFPFLYWPISSDQPIPSDEAYARLNEYLRTGGMILFDTRDADIGGFGAETPEGRKLQQLARPLDVPPLEPVPQDHVLTRTFYLLQDFPGRHTSRDVWVEAAPPDAEQVDGMPFRNLNDNVTPVVIGGNDWATAWAVDEGGQAMFPVGRGYAGERQREIAYRFGVNLIMHVLTGNYKSDQVHVPALLERLGQ